MRDALGDLGDKTKTSGSGSSKPSGASAANGASGEVGASSGSGASGEAGGSSGADGSTSSTEGGSSEGSWLLAIASAMGEAMGKEAGKMVKLANDMRNAGGGSDQEKAQAFSQMQAEFQATSQMFSMLQNAFSTALKSIGEGLSSMARKQ